MISIGKAEQNLDTIKILLKKKLNIEGQITPCFILLLVNFDFTSEINQGSIDDTVVRALASWVLILDQV